MVEVALLLDTNCSIFLFTLEFSAVSSEEKELQEICPVIVLLSGKQVHTVVPWNDMCTFSLSVELRVGIWESEMAHEGVSWERKTAFFFLRQWKCISAELLTCWIFCFILFIFEKTLSVLLPYASFSEISPANVSVCSRDSWSTASELQHLKFYGILWFSGVF